VISCFVTRHSLHVESMEIGLTAIEQTLRLAYCEALPKHYPSDLAVLRAVSDA